MEVVGDDDGVRRARGELGPLLERDAELADELLRATPPTEIVTDAVIRGQDTPWLFVLTVEVENPTDAPYELQLETLTLGSGKTVAGGASTGRVPPDGTGQVTGAWEIPEGSTPATLAVRAIAHREDGRQETTDIVDLAKVPVRGG